MNPRNDLERQITHHNENDELLCIELEPGKVVLRVDGIIGGSSFVVHMTDLEFDDVVREVSMFREACKVIKTLEG